MIVFILALTVMNSNGILEMMVKTERGQVKLFQSLEQCKRDLMEVGEIARSGNLRYVVSCIEVKLPTQV